MVLPMPVDELVTTGQIATRFKVHPSTVHRWIEQGLIAVAHNANGVRLVSGSEVDRFAATRAEAKS